MMLEPVGEEDEADLLRQDDDANQSGWLLYCDLLIGSISGCYFVMTVT